ncbi:hypothetical protein HHI36_019603 [Cryptolaemus montrouzieri]|uniref:Uncharacterized protein n=1 Tax=Cryptolaemus montrouzieri TaxID=559131 RepID=A0ABD2N8Y7_9CUCU
MSTLIHTFVVVCEAISEGISIIIDVTWTGMDAVEELSMKIQLPYIRLDLTISPFLTLLDEYLDFRNSTDVLIIFDDASNVDQLLFFWINSRRMRLVVSEKLDTTVATKIKRIRPMPNNYAVVAKTQNMSQIFRKALDEGLVTLPERWNLIFLDFDQKNFDRTLIYGKPINLLFLDEEVCCRVLDTPSPCSCTKNVNVQEKILEFVLSKIHQIFVSMKNEEYEIRRNINCEETSDNEDLKKRFDKLFHDVLKSTDVIYEDREVVRMKIRGTVEVGTRLSSDLIAKYDTDTGMRLLPNKRIKAIKPFYRIGITHALPWSYKETDEDGNTYWTGYCADFARELAIFLDFDFEFVEPTEGTFGKKVNGRWNGVVGDLQTGETDLAITALIMTADKEEVIDFVPPFFAQSGISIVMRKPVRKTSLFKFMTVLKLEVWLSIVGALIVTGFMIWFLDKYSPYSAKNNKKAYPYPCRDFTLKESFWFALTSFTPQGGGEAPKALSGRTLVAAYWLFVVLMLATFTANLAAFLTVERMQFDFATLQHRIEKARKSFEATRPLSTIEASSSLQAESSLSQAGPSSSQIAPSMEMAQIASSSAHTTTAALSPHTATATSSNIYALLTDENTHNTQDLR